MSTRCFWFRVDYERLNPFPNYWYRAAFDALMLTAGLAIVFSGVEMGWLR